MHITFIGNCQLLSLCFYLQQLLGANTHNISWLMYGDEFKPHIGDWAIKCKNKITNYDKAIEQIKLSDIIIYQEISLEKSSFSNTAKLQENKKESCKLIKLPSIYLDYSKYDESIKELEGREKRNNVDIVVSDIINCHRDKRLLFNFQHPTTFLFLEIMKKLCVLLNIDYFSEEKAALFLQNSNYMRLP